MNVKKILSNVQNTIVKNSPTILAVMGGVGAIASVGLAIDGTCKTKKDFANAKEDMSTPDKVAIYIKNYTPTALMLVATEICIYGSNHINQKRLATLAGAYILSETNFKDYKEKVEELLGEKKFNELNNDIIQKHVNETPQTERNTCKAPVSPNNGVQLSLWFDETSKRYFYSSAEYIRKAELEANKLLQKNGYVSLNDVYDILGIEPIILGNDMGWRQGYNDEVIINIGAALMGPDIPVGTIIMDVHPCSTWLSEI